MTHKLVQPEAHPPAYSVHPHAGDSPVPQPSSPHPQIPGAYPHRAQLMFDTNIPPSFTPPPHFGPTPLLQSDPTLGLLPYYDPRSPYAIAEATTRARWRFICASLWTVGIIALLLAVSALEGLRDI